MSVPDLATAPDVAGQSRRSGLRYRIHGSVQQTAIIDLAPAPFESVDYLSPRRVVRYTAKLPSQWPPS